LTYVWFSSIRALLHLFQRLSMATTWKINAGFLQTSPSITIDPRNRDGQHFLDMVRTYDVALIEQWRAGRHITPQSFTISATIPHTHFRGSKTLTKTPPPSIIPTGTRRAASSKAKRQRPSNVTNDFCSSAPMFNFVEAPPQFRGGVVQRLISAAPPDTKMPKLPQQSDGKYTLICFASSVAPPFNTCCTAECFQTQKQRDRNIPNPSPFLHIDLNELYWANQSEAFYEPIVSYLLLPGVSSQVRPSTSLKAKTPSTPW
jgi:hypothetical protein